MNTELRISLKEIRDIFSIFDDEIDKFSQIVDMGKKAKGLDDEEKNVNNKIVGCASQSWVVTIIDKKDKLFIRTDSEAIIVRGLLYILEKILNGKNKKIIYEIEAKDILENIKLNRNITSQRTNGFISAIDKIRYQITNADR
tara:strand:- start:258 stop:683 length:426 start_codon:yes stop_codon:yes gene_type:complete